MCYHLGSKDNTEKINGMSSSIAEIDNRLTGQMDQLFLVILGTSEQKSTYHCVRFGFRPVPGNMLGKKEVWGLEIYT